jgi:hypothetical protein
MGSHIFILGRVNLNFILMEFIFGTLRATVVGGGVEKSSQ